MNREFWEALWDREARFMLDNKKEFRHGIPFVAVSSIAEQFYCEYKIENEFALGEIPTESKDAGTALHDELLPTEEVSKEEFAGLVSSKKPSLAVLRVWGAIGGLKIIGMPDHIVWKDGRPLWLVELKTTKGDPAPLWEDQENQARIYGLLLDLMGFDCREMKLAVVRLKSDELKTEKKIEWAQKVSEMLLRDEVAQMESENAGLKVHIMKHDRSLASRAVDLKAGYWLGRRDASSSDSVGKCRACEYNSVCPKSLFTPALSKP